MILFEVFWSAIIIGCSFFVAQSSFYLNVTFGDGSCISVREIKRIKDLKSEKFVTITR